ncbi:precorrin-6y C5,15-methyltransferase (decarboxylating) subunit CbiE [Eionea flava]
MHKPLIKSTDSPSIHVVGLGVAEHAVLAINVRAAIESADIIFGSSRQLATIDHSNQVSRAEKKILPPLSSLATTLTQLFDTSTQPLSVVILASGDPLYYGIGRWLSRQFSQIKLAFYPAVSSIQAACHCLGLALQDVDVISLHGRPLVSIRSVLRAQQTLVILTDRHSHPYAIAEACIDAGFADSTLSVCEQLGYPQQQVQTFSVRTLMQHVSDQQRLTFNDLHVSVVATQGDGGVLPEFPGIPDVQFSTGMPAGKGMISKREVRLAILSQLQTNNHDIVWDIGAGCGGVAVELSRWHPQAQIYAVECHSERLKYLAMNRDRFGVVKNLHIVAGRAPDILSTLPTPHKIFIGGSDGELPALLEQAWSLLPAGGTLVVSAVIEKTQRIVEQFVKMLVTSKLIPAESIESTEVGITRRYFSDSLQWDEQKKLPVTLYTLIKPRESKQVSPSKINSQAQGEPLVALPTFCGVGVGPGDPELLTLKAQRMIQQADVISYLCNEHGHSQAYTIAERAIADINTTGQTLLPIVMPMKEERKLANLAYDNAASAIAAALADNKQVVFLCEGDPLFFGSFAYLLERLQNSAVEHRSHVVPGISSINAAASILQHPLTMLTESFAVMSGRHSEEQLLNALMQHDSVVIMKAGRARVKILQALAQSQRTADACYLEYVGRAQEKIVRDVEILAQESGPYFSLFVITNDAQKRAMISSKPLSQSSS